MIIYDCGISVGYVETEKNRRHRKSGKIKGLWFLVGQKFSEVLSTKKSEKKDGWRRETRIFEIKEAKTIE